MSAIKKVTRTAYFSPSKGRHYFSLSSAINAEAHALIAKKHPTEYAKFDLDGSGGGFYWVDDIDRSDVLLRRVKRLVKKEYSEGARGDR